MTDHFERKANEIKLPLPLDLGSFECQKSVPETFIEFGNLE
jgi:hypothetical protein